MKLIADSMATRMESGSWIRKMFEAGIQLKKEFGNDAVCDFSLGNPDLPAPAAVRQGLEGFAKQADQPFSLGYMPNAGFAWARETLAQHLAIQQKVALQSQDVIITCGAAGALNCLFKAVLNPGDEVLAMRPYFVEYGAYVDNHGGVLKTVPTLADTFQLDLEAVKAAITPQTRAVIINSPNNPTGAIYPQKDLEALSSLLRTASEQYNRPIFLVSDEPYRFLAYDDNTVPAILPLYEYALVASSFSKNLSLAGERIGFLALSPHMQGRNELMDALTMANRILGFVNPPVIGQHILDAAIDAQVDADIYARRRNLMAEVLHAAGYQFQMPAGAFYFFPKAPGGDDVSFVNNALLEQKILAVPGTGFGGPGHFRLAFCVPEEVITRSLDGFKRALERV